MKTKRIDGLLFEKMLLNGLACLAASEEEVNSLNVFPVADGDTATNMLHTLGNGLAYAKAVPQMGAYLKQLSEGMLLGARGNSGVLLSQIFRGIREELSHCGAANAADMRSALIRGYKTAYKAMDKPKEGTILTVAREGIEHIRSAIDRSTTVDSLLSMYLAEMRKTLPHTPEMLPVLKEAGVIDSGALGYILIVEGMVKQLYGEVIDAPSAIVLSSVSPTDSDIPAPELFNENTPFEEGYCMEFVLQRMNRPHYNKNFRLERYTEDLALYGSSIAVVEDKKRVRVHIHTHLPDKVAALSREYGEFLTFKLDNMQVQTNELRQKKAQKLSEHKPISIIAVCDGEGMNGLFTSLGCDCVINGGASMNTSSQEFIDIFKMINADHIVVLPNDKNIIPAALQAKDLYGRKNIHVLPTRSMAEGYFALAMDDPQNKDAGFRIAQMESGAKDTSTLLVTTASKNYKYHEISCRAGDCIAILDDELVAVNGSMLSVLVSGIDAVPDIDDKETLVIFRGENTPEDDEAELGEKLDAAYPLLDKEYIYGGESTYDWMVGII